MTKLHRTRSTLCSTLAIATALMVGASPAVAQALLGTVTSSSGVGTITNGPGSTVIPVTGQQAIINWSATGPSSGGVTTFSNAGSTTSFTGTNNFAILNRVAPTAAGNSIFMGGNINSLVNGQVGGTVYFYSPNGIVIGSNASINVGSLGLTTLPIADAEGFWMSGFGTASPRVAFGAATNAASFVRTAGGSVLNANGFGNYVALVAPRIEHRGTIRTDSGAALVAAGAATITFSPSGLYNIAVTAGSIDANGVVVDGGRIERNSAAGSTPHRAYLVSVPANNAMTMLVQGRAQLGFDIAGAAGVEGNAVVLSAGHDIANGAASGVSAGAAGTDGDITLVDSSFTSRVAATARDNFFADANSGTMRFSDDLTVRARLGQIEASGGATQLLIDGDLSIDVSKVALTAGESAVSAGYNLLTLTGATMTVAGTTSINASARGGDSSTAGVASGSATGGTVFVQAQSGSTINLSTGLTVSAGATAGSTGASGVDSGHGQGGNIFIDSVTGNSRVNVAGFLSLEANASGGLAQCVTCSGIGGNGTGGTVLIRTFLDANNNISITGPSVLAANGTGTSGNSGASGTGTGGIARVSTTTTGLVSLGSLLMSAGGFGGDHNAGGIAGAGNGGSALVSASGGGTVSISDAILVAEALGGSSMGAGGTGGAANGGNAQLLASGGTLNILSTVDLSADAIGGTGNAKGGAADGGLAHLGASAGGDLAIAGGATLTTFGFGGSGHVGGRASGGSASIDSTGAGSTLVVKGFVNSDVVALGGSGSAFSAGGLGGNAVGGSSLIRAADGALLELDSLLALTSAVGGEGATGGNASGGQITLSASGMGSALAVISSTLLLGTNSGGASFTGAGGNAVGGRIDILADRGSVTLRDFLFAMADAQGGWTEAPGTSGGLGRGGQINAGAANGGTLTTLSAMTLQADGVGGGSFEANATSGPGFGGTIALNATGTGSMVEARSTVSLSADGSGGFAGGECIACGGGGGDGTGGTVSTGTSGGLGNRLLFGGDVFLSANGLGSGGSGGAGGNGQGGAASVFLGNDGQILVGGSLALHARGDGGYQFNGGQAGTGTGGDAQINLAGVAASLLTVGTSQGVGVNRSTTLDSSGYGGSAGVVAQGVGGAGTGGWSRIYGTGGTAFFGGDVRIVAEGEGGNGENASGGAGIGGRARLNADGAAYHLGTTVAIITDATGGTGRNGGAASLRAVENDVNNSGMFANNGGSILVDGAATLSANAIGGNGTSGGNGGSASAGRSSVVVNGSATGNGSITVASVNVTADALGGIGAAGGTALTGGIGGNATGGLAEVAVNNSASGTNRLTAGTTYLSALANGGAGGRGGDGPNGSGGGSGGVGTGGTALALTSAGNGALNLTDLSLFATGTGGGGGAGGTGTNGSGGIGGAGGVGDGGTVIIGLVSGTPTAATNGTFNAATLVGWADSYGGTGGNGGTGTLGSGSGGNGGDALHSFNQLLARGGTVTIGEARLLVDTRGGDGGLGATDGNGGTAYTPQVTVTVTNRFEQPTARASLIVGELDFYSVAHPSTGAVAGRAIALGGPQLLVQNSTARFGSFSMFSTAGGGIDPASLADPLRIINGAVNVDTGFRFESDNRLTVLLDNGSLNAGSVIIDGADFERDSTVPTPATLGVISAGTISVLSGRNILLDANLSSGGALTLTAPGSVTVGSLTTTGTTGADILVTGGTNVTTGAINAGRAVNLRAGGTLTTSAVTARGDVALNAVGAIAAGAVRSVDGGIRIVGGGNIATGTLAAGGGVLLNATGAIATGTIAARWAELLAVGAISVGDATTSEWFDAEAGGALAVGNVTAGESIALAAQGALAAGNLSAGMVNDAVREGAGYDIGILAGTSVAVGNAAARDWIGIGARGALTAGAIASRNDVVLAADGAITTGAIATGPQNRLLIAGADMVALGGRNEDFDRNRLFAALGTTAEAATRGAVTIGGPVSTGRLDALVGADFTTGAVSATNAAHATVGGTMVINGAWASALTRILSNDLVLSSSGGISGGRTDLISRNATQLLVGDGLSGSGYAIDNAEFGRLSTTTINIVGRSDASAAIDTLVGTLSLAGRAGGSSVTIAAASGSASAPAGSLRVTGAINGTGLGATDALTLAAGRVEIDATTGGVSLRGSGEQLAGALTLTGQRIHVAEGAILDRLAADPNYAARDADLARAPVTQRPDGVVRAGQMIVKLVDPPGQVSAAVGTAALPPYSVLVQNVGTSRIPAGFAATTAEIVSPSGAAPGSIDLNVNGQLIAPSGTLTGVAVRDALMADDNPARFTASSLINGCALTGPCGSVQAPLDPTPAISTEIALLTTVPADDALFGNEEAIEDNEEEGGDDSASSPIAPPAPLFNTKPLEQKSDTDEPVSGGGNPALIGSGRVEGEK